MYESQRINKIKSNDMVLVQLPNKPRPFRLLGRVMELQCTDANRVRCATIKRGDGQIQQHSLKYLYPLELSLTHDSKHTSNSGYEIGTEFR